MNDTAFENKVHQDVDKTKKDLTSLRDDTITGLGKIKNDFVTLGEDSNTEMGRKLEQLAGDTKEMVTDTLKTVNKDVGRGLSQYNAKVQDVADRFPGSFGTKAAGYPWVTITISLVFGLLLGVLLKPGRQPVG